MLKNLSSSDMDLPEGKTAIECVFFWKCSKLFGCKGKNTTCDFSPSRFFEKTKKNEEAKITTV